MTIELLNMDCLDYMRECKEVCLIEEVITSLKKVEESDCTEEVFWRIEAAIEDLENVL